jgi:RND family efflux transporter MFP subunit
MPGPSAKSWLDLGPGRASSHGPRARPAAGPPGPGTTSPGAWSRVTCSRRRGEITAGDAWGARENPPSARCSGGGRLPSALRWLGLTAALLPAVAPAQQTEAAPVVVDAAVERELAPVTWYPGTVMSRNDARLAAEGEGRVVFVADIGTRVKAGDTVVRLDDDLLLQLRSEAQADLAAREARLRYLDKQLKRLSQLARQNNVAQNQLDEALSDRDVTRGELAAARARLLLIGERLKRTQVRAPFDGVVSERLVQIGEWAESGTAVIRLVDTEALEVQTRVPSTSLDYLHEGLVLRMGASPAATTGRVRTIVPVGGDRSRLYELRLTLEDSPWPAGQSLRVAIPTAAPRAVVAIPRDALVLRREGTSVFRIRDDDTAERVEVGTGVASGRYIEVKGDIGAGDRVVVRGG